MTGEQRLRSALIRLRRWSRFKDQTLEHGHVLTLLEFWREAKAAGVTFGACWVSFEGRSFPVRSLSTTR